MTDPSSREPRGSEYAEHLKAVLEDASQRETARRSAAGPPPDSWAGGALVSGLFAVFLAVVAYNVVLFRERPLPPTPEEVRVTQGASVLVATQAVEAFREEHGRLPRSLEEAGVPPGMMVYEVTGDSAYELHFPDRPADGPAGAPTPLEALEELGIAPEDVR